MCSAENCNRLILRIEHVNGETMFSLGNATALKAPTESVSCAARAHSLHLLDFVRHRVSEHFALPAVFDVAPTAKVINSGEQNLSSGRPLNALPERLSAAPAVGRSRNRVFEKGEVGHDPKITPTPLGGVVPLVLAAESATKPLGVFCGQTRDVFRFRGAFNIPIARLDNAL